MCLGSAPLTDGAAGTAAFTELLRQRCPLLLRDLFLDLHQWDCTEEREQLRHFRRKFTSEKRLLKELSYFHVLYFFDLSLFIFFLLKNPSGHPCGHHVQEIGN